VPEAIVTNEADNPNRHDRIIRNAKRLLDDAALLKKEGRHDSAFALSVLGLEEIGKAILRLWDLSDHLPGYLYHLCKQLAVSSLLMVDALVRETKAQAGRGMVPPPSSPAAQRIEWAAALEKRIAKAAMDSEAGRFSELVDTKLINAMKNFALYYDGSLEEADLPPDWFKPVYVENIFKVCSRALGVIEDDQTVQELRLCFLPRRTWFLPRNKFEGHSARAARSDPHRDHRRRLPGSRRHAACVPLSINERSNG
jgi:hypothetical protein